MDRKINVLVVPSDRFGCGLYRSVSPHVKLDEMFGNEFNVEINYEPNWNDVQSLNKYDIIHFHKGLFRDMEAFTNALKYCKEHNIVTVMDIDDYWDVGQYHPLYRSSKTNGMSEKITNNLRLADYVTTTTDIFANKIRKWNKNVLVYPNAIDPNDEQFSMTKNPSNRIRFGFVMGSSHKKDMEQIIGVFGSLDKSILDKIQVVLCGYDLRGNVQVIDENGKVTGTRPISELPTKSVWYEYERIVTNDFKIVSDNYKDFLFKFLPNAQYPLVDNECYRREWTKNVKEYGKHYNNVDVLLVPLHTTPFNEVKSELKFVEAGFTNTAVVATDFGPYQIGSVNLFEKGGTINENGNCILIDPSKKHKAWAKAIKKLVENPQLIDLLKHNMHEHVKDTYNLENVTKKRAEWYKQIIRKD